MSQEPVALARQLLAALGAGEAPAGIAALFSEDVLFEIPGDDGVLPWIGRQRGRAAVAAFIEGTRGMTEPLVFDIQDVLGNGDKAVILGALSTRIKATGKVVDSDIAIILTVTEGMITRFQMLEDSFAVSRAAQA